MNNEEKTSLERSHSKKSNTILTLLCLFASLCFGLLWSIIGLQEQIINIAGEWLYWLGTIVSSFLCILCLLLFNFFKR